MCIDKRLKDVRCSDKCEKACYKLTSETQTNQSFDWSKWLCALWHVLTNHHFRWPDKWVVNTSIGTCTKCTLYLSTTNCLYCEIIFICWTCSLVYFMGRTIQEFKIQMKYLFILVIFNIIWNPWMQVSTNMSNVVKPRY